jgi:hypothetical protein
MFKKYYSSDEIIRNLKKLEIEVTLRDLKDLCIRGELTPTIHFEGNLVCIKDERYQDPLDKYSIAHCESVSWSKTFNGYIHSKNFANFLESSLIKYPKTDVFFTVDEIIENLSKDEIPALKEDEYFKVFPSKIDDDIRHTKWLRESKVFEGNRFDSTEIVFHHSEVEKLLSLKDTNHQVAIFHNIDGSSNGNRQLRKYPLYLSYDIYAYFEAACVGANYNPIEAYNFYGTPEFYKKYPGYAEVYNLIKSGKKSGALPPHQIPAEDLKQFLYRKKIIILGFNDPDNYTPTQIKDTAKQEIEELKKQLKYKEEEIENLKQQLEQSESEVEILRLREYPIIQPNENNLINLIFDDSVQERYSPDLANAIKLWEHIYINRPKDDSHTNMSNQWISSNTGYNENQTGGKKSIERLKEITTPFVEWGNQRNKNYKNS